MESPVKPKPVNQEPAKPETASPVKQESGLPAPADDGSQAARRPQSGDAWQDIAKLEADLWSAADNLRANSKLTSSDYFMPVLGVIFLRHAQNRFDAATRQIEQDQAAGRMPPRPIIPADYIRRRALFLPDQARFDHLLAQAGGGHLPTLINAAMTAIEESFPDLAGVLPKDYGIFNAEPEVLEDLMRKFDSDLIRHAGGDVFGRIYEYFLAQFSVQKAHDNGEFFTPAALVQMIVNVIEPDHGIVADLACGSGGMFVQSSHFIEHEGLDTNRQVTFYGQEKNKDTIRIAKMNLAVHGLSGKIAEAITYYQDEHSIAGRCDFVMANPPFNVDLVDAERAETDKRLPFGLPGVNKAKKVANANYLWISYFYSYLNDTGRAGFVMSSQASSAGHAEREVRRRIVQSGAVDVMLAVRSGFFYTRGVPCELWFFDRAKPAERIDSVLMLDARNVFRQVTRKINDFSPEQLSNLTAIVWLHRGQTDRFLGLVSAYLERLYAEADEVPMALDDFDLGVDALGKPCTALVAATDVDGALGAAHKQALREALEVLDQAHGAYESARDALLAILQHHGYAEAEVPDDNAGQHAAREGFNATAKALTGMVEQIDEVQRALSRLHALAGKLPKDIAKQKPIKDAYPRNQIASSSSNSTRTGSARRPNWSNPSTCINR